MRQMKNQIHDCTELVNQRDSEVRVPTRHLLNSSLLLISRIGHLAQLVFLGEFSGQNSQILDQSLAGIDYCVARGDLAIRLYAQLEVGGQGVRDLVNKH